MKIRFRLFATDNNIYAINVRFMRQIYFFQTRDKLARVAFILPIARASILECRRRNLFLKGATLFDLSCAHTQLKRKRGDKGASSILDSRSPLTFEIPLKRNTYFEKCLHHSLTNRSSNCWIFRIAIHSIVGQKVIECFLFATLRDRLNPALLKIGKKKKNTRIMTAI